MLKLKYAIASVIFAGLIVGGLPYVVKNSIDSIIEKKEKELDTKGIQLKVISHKGYYQSTREINIKFIDTIKVLDYISEITNLDIKTVKSITNNGMIFSDISFNGIVTNSNLFSQTIQSKITLDELPLALQENMSKDAQLDKFIKSLMLNVDFNDVGIVSFVSLNDIIIQENGAEVKIIKPELVLDEGVYNTSIKNITISANEQNENLLIYLDDIKDTLKYTDEFNFEEKANISKMQFEYKSRYTSKDIQYKSLNNTIQSKMNISDNHIDANIGYDINDVFLNVQSTVTKIENFIFNVKLNELKEQPLRELNKALTDEYTFERILVPKLQEIVNDGFKIDIDSKIKNITNPNISAKNIGIDLDFTVLKNSLNQNSSIDQALRYLNVEGKISLDEETKNKLSQLFPIQKYDINPKNGISSFDIKFKNSILFINGKKIQ